MAVWSLHKQRGTDKDIRGLRPTVNTSPLSRGRNSMSHFMPGQQTAAALLHCRGLQTEIIFACISSNIYRTEN
jgi:hypothetical protein